MTPMRLLYYCLWVAPHIVQGVIVFLMFRRRLQRHFPMFLVYTEFEILQFVVLITISLSSFQFGAVYARVYSVGLALSTAIRFALIHELFRHFFRRYPMLEAPGRLLFRCVTIVLLLVAVGLAVSAPGNGATFLLNATYALDRTVSIMQCGLLISLFLFSRYFVLSWRSHAFGIALGLGIFACVELAASAIRLQVGTFGNTVVNLSVMATYNCCVLIWLFYLMAEDRESPRPRKTLRKRDLEIWNQELQHLLPR
jgi:hypothetical protein